MGKRILCVDDDPEIAFILRAWFKGTANEVDYCLNGIDALTLISRQHYDVVLTDYKMAFMDGMELCRKIRATRAYRHLPVILLTAFSDPTPAKFKAEGAAEVIRKPIRREVFLKRMEKYLLEAWAPPKENARSAERPAKLEPERVAQKDPAN